MAGYLSEVIRPPKFYERSDESHIETLRDWIPRRWKNGDRDSIESIGEILGEAKQYELWRKIGCESWEDYCSAFLNARSDAMDELIEGVRILQGQGPISEDQARQAAAVKARNQKEQADKNKLGGISLPDNIKKVQGGGTSAAYRLRRLAREAPEILEAYERGEFKSVTAAVRAAGIERKENPLTALRRIWKQATPEQRQEMAIWVSEQAGAGNALPKVNRNVTLNKFVNEAVMPAAETASEQRRSIGDLPPDLSPCAREVSMITAMARAHEKALPKAIDALGKLAVHPDWSGRYLVADKADYNWRTAPWRRYESFADFYQRECAAVWRGWAELHAIYQKLTIGKVDTAG
jgi:hypothetical protein